MLKTPLARRLPVWIEELGQIGRTEADGLWRTPYTPEDTQAQDAVAGWMRDAGLQVRRDAVGNLFGRLPGTTRPDEVILTGSHLDTVRNGGKYDGGLGILAGIVMLAEVLETSGRPARSLEVVALVGEEGSRFPLAFIGSKAITGELSPEELEIRDAEGISIAQAMRGVGLDPSRIQEARRSDLRGFLEFHIEQGRILQDQGYPLGIVHTITGIKQARVLVDGRPDHAGTTPMTSRRDAMLGAAEMVLRIAEQITALGHPAVATTGRLQARPGGVNVVAEQVEFTVDFRHPDPAVLERMAAMIRGTCDEVAHRRGLGATLHVFLEHPPVPMSPEVQAALQASAEELGLKTLSMASGAGHDAMVLAGRVPVGMLFVPSREGRSHCPDEFTPEGEIVPGLAVLARTLHRLATV